MNLDHNDFETVGAQWIKDALLQNENLKILDLSWNKIRLKGAEHIGVMIQVRKRFLLLYKSVLI